MPKAPSATQQPTPSTLAPAPSQQQPAAEPAAAHAVSRGLSFAQLDDVQEFLNVLYYGREGSGKTTNALSMALLPHPGRVLAINIEGGLKRGALAKRGIPTERIAIWPTPGERPSFAGLEQLHEQLLWELQQDPSSWLGVVFDSVTEGAALLREDATTDRYKRLKDAGRNYDPTFIDRADYGVQSDQLQRLLRRFRDLPCHFVVTALERLDEDTGVYGPAVNPALANSLLGYVDLALYTKASQHSVENTDEVLSEFRAATRPSNTWRGKDRYDLLPHVMADPTFERVHAYITGDLTEQDDLAQVAYLERQAEQAAQAEAEAAAKQAARAERRKSARS